MNDLQLFPIKFNEAAAMADIKEAIDVCLDELSANFQEVIRREILENGNGSRIMKFEALKHVKEIERTIKGNEITLEVGVDETEPASEQARIRTIVVLHGNLAGGPLFTKPGQRTWKKHVTGPSDSTAVFPYRLVDFEQTDVSGYLLSNSMKNVKQYVAAFLRAIEETLNSFDWSEYLVGGG